MLLLQPSVPRATKCGEKFPEIFLEVGIPRSKVVAQIVRLMTLVLCKTKQDRFCPALFVMLNKVLEPY